MNIRFAKAWLALGAAVALAGCGGGGGDAGTPAPSPAATPASPPATGAPTASLSASQTTADALVASSKAAAASLAQLGSLAVLLSAPNGLTTTNTQACDSGGTLDYTYTFAREGQPTAGDAISAVYTDCAYVPDAAVSGSMVLTYTRFTSQTNFALDVTATGLTYVTSGVTYGPTQFSATIDLAGSTLSFSSTINGYTVVGQPTVSVSGSSVTIASGTARADLGSGWVQIAYSGWQYDSVTGIPTAGTITITGSNSDTAMITVGSGGYAVSITSGGATTQYTVPAV